MVKLSVGANFQLLHRFWHYSGLKCQKNRFVFPDYLVSKKVKFLVPNWHLWGHLYLNRYDINKLSFAAVLDQLCAHKMVQNTKKKQCKISKQCKNVLYLAFLCSKVEFRAKSQMLVPWHNCMLAPLRNSDRRHRISECVWIVLPVPNETKNKQQKDPPPANSFTMHSRLVQRIRPKKSKQICKNAKQSV